MHPQVYRLNQSSPVIVTDGVTRRVLARGGRLMLCELHLQKDAQTPKLPAPQELVLCVHTGAALLRTEQGDIELNAGDSAYVPPGGTYGLTALAENTTVGETYTPQVAELLPEF